MRVKIHLKQEERTQMEKVLVKLFLIHQKESHNDTVLGRPPRQVQSSGSSKLLFGSLHKKGNTAVLVKLLDHDFLDC